MSHPNPSHDRENEYPSDDYKPVQKKHAMAKKMSNAEAVKKLFNTHGDVMKMLNKLTIRGKRKTPSWFKKGQGGGGLPPGRKDEDNE